MFQGINSENLSIMLRRQYIWVSIRYLHLEGAYSNHIAAVAAVGRLEGMKTIGIIRGEELQGQALNSQTLLRAQKDGMKFRFVSRNYIG